MKERHGRLGAGRRVVRQGDRKGRGSRVAAALFAGTACLCLSTAGTADEAAPTGESTTVASRPPGDAQVRNLVRVEGPIDSSLYEVGLKHDVPPAVMIEVVTLFGFGVDFERDLKPGDRFEVMYEQVHDENNQAVRSGDLLFAALTLGGEKLSLWRYRPKGGTTEYFNAKGQSLRTGLMRSPIDGARLSSPFGPRKHPILGYSRMHQGVDFAAPIGTPIYAAGDGVVELAEMKGGYGNYILIRHDDGYDTAYAHLQAFAGEIKPGDRVRQGQIIGTVGTTGLSTGPHLHYEVHVGETAVDPDSVRLPPRTILTGAELASFQWHSSLLKIRPTVPPDPLLRQYSGAR
jgi:murein DD-endopeptidase MepM/ murein hydrolase activator NlpD